MLHPVIGLITGNSAGSVNVEREFHRQLSELADIATTRVPLYQISYEYLEQMISGLPSAAEILAACYANVIVWTSMSGSCLRGQETVNTLEQKTGIPVLVPSLEFLKCLRELKAERIALVSPHSVELTLLEKIFFDRNQIHVAKVIRLVDESNADVRVVDRITPPDILSRVRQADFRDVDAVIFDNPACSLLPIMDELEQLIAKPILPHSQVLMRGALRRIGLPSNDIFIDRYFQSPS